ncbi:MAG: hypothetical protein JWN17_1773 [Frankiales bacterium]|nr:hypothetical protein [Frankiales bacterium]
MTSTSRTGSVVDQMRTFVEENFLYLRPEVVLGDGDDLLALGLIDSMGFVELVEQVQSRFGVQVDDAEITEANFGSLAAMGAFVARHGQE